MKNKKQQNSTANSNSGNKKDIVFKYVCLFFLFANITSCKKFVQLDPPVTSISGKTVYNNNTSAAATMTSVYDNMIGNYGPGYMSSGTGSISYLMGLASDELINYTSDPESSQFYKNALSSSVGNSTNYYFWQELYKEIHVCNAALEGLSQSTGVSASMKNQLIGEAKFMRAFLHFYATNLYGDVPIVTSTDYQINNVIHRSPAAVVYQQIINDLLDAKAKLSDNFVDASGNTSSLRVRPNKGAATALLARVYLYMGQSHYADAEAQATAVINTTSYGLASNPDGVFLINSTEAIWQLQSIFTGINTFDGYFFILSAPPGSGQVSVSLNANVISAFEAGDLRRLHWVGTLASNANTYYYANKYKIGVYDPSLPVTEYTTVLRLAEQYLIRAEARAQLGNLSGAKADLNIIRARAGLPQTTAMTQQSLLTAILHERQVEFFTEWGHRWFDLKRTGNLNTIMGAPGNVCQSKGGIWNSYKSLLPLPFSEIQINHNLTQNSGY